MLRFNHRYVELLNKINSWEYRRPDDQHVYRCKYHIAIVISFTLKQLNEIFLNEQVVKTAVTFLNVLRKTT